MIIFSDYAEQKLFSKMVQEIGTFDDMSWNQTSFNPSTDLFLLDNPKFDKYHKIGTHFACPGNQKYNHIPLSNVLTWKDQVTTAVKTYAKYYDNRIQCFDPGKFMPETYVLSDKADCKKIREALINDKGKRMWLAKHRNLHNTKGVYIISEENTDYWLDEIEKSC
jgi:hypothetical protein